MTLPLVVLFALAYSGLVLFALASALRKVFPSPMRAALAAFALSAVVHGVTPFLADPERWVPLTLFWLVPHLLLLPLLLWAARRQTPRNGGA